MEDEDGDECVICLCEAKAVRKITHTQRQKYRSEGTAHPAPLPKSALADT
jgi:hypothetical protein